VKEASVTKYGSTCDNFTSKAYKGVHMGMHVVGTLYRATAYVVIVCISRVALKVETWLILPVAYACLKD
jgi:hypothetical protein